MSVFAVIIVVSSMLLVLGSLAIGIFVMAKGGETNKKFSNKLMQVRVYLQGGAIILLILIAMIASAQS